MPDENGVVTFRATPGTLADAIRSAPAPKRRMRRAAPVDAVALAGHILRELPEAEPGALKVAASAGLIIAERDAEIARLCRDAKERGREIVGLRDRCDTLFATAGAKDATIADLRKGISVQAGARHDIDLILDGVPGLSRSGGDQAGDVAELAGKYLRLAAGAGARLAAMTAVLERFAAPGAITATDRRRAASEALASPVADDAGKVPAVPQGQAQDRAEGFPA